MAEDREGPRPQEINSDGLTGRVRERAKGALDWFIDRNPIAKSQQEAFDGIQRSLPKGRLKEIARLAIDVTKVPRAGIASLIEGMKRGSPLIRAALFLPELAASFEYKTAGFVAEKVVESAPAKFAVGTVEGVMDGILGKRAPTVEAPKATIENAHQILVGMARPETGVKERRKMG